MAFALSILLAAGALCPCLDGSSRPSWEVLESRSTGPIAEAGVWWYSDEVSWQTARTEWFGREPQPTWSLDWSQDALLVVAMGRQRSGGYALALDEVIPQADGTLTLRITRQSPGPGSIVTMMLTEPYLILRLPKTAVAPVVEFRDVETP